LTLSVAESRVAQGFSVGVVTSGWNGFGESVAGDAEFPLVAGGVFGWFDQAVVVVAQERQVGEVGGAAVPPGIDVVCFTHSGARVAAGEHAAAVAHGERSAQSAGDESVFSAHIKHFGCGAEDGRYQIGVAAQLA